VRILHVVTLVSPDSAYGGPVRVAENQCTELLSRGHDVQIAAGVRGYESVPDTVGAVPAQLFPVRTTIPRVGFAGLRAAGLVQWVRHHADEFDVAHVHLARDFVTLPAALALLRAGTPVVVQPHGMIDESGRLLAKPLDRFLTKPVLRAASSVFHLTAREFDDLVGVAGDAIALRELHNGVPEASDWDDVSPAGGDEVLFLARLHPRKRPTMFVRMAAALVEADIDAHFSLVGPDEGEGAAVANLIEQSSLQSRVRYEGPLKPAQSISRMRRAKVYVLPSVDEPYPMSVLEAMSVGLPVVVTDTCGLAPLVAASACGLVVASDDVESLTDAVRTILETPGLASEMGENARRTVTQRLGMSAVADMLEQSYRRAIIKRVAPV
jgi:glycosyltransferase involved in cell wall biosynthesis